MTFGLLAATVNQAAFIVPEITIARTSQGLLLRDTFTRANTAAGNPGAPEFDALSLGENWKIATGAAANQYSINNFRLRFPDGIATDFYHLIHSASYDESKGWIAGANIFVEGPASITSRRNAQNELNNNEISLRAQYPGGVPPPRLNLVGAETGSLFWNSTGVNFTTATWQAYRLIHFAETGSMGAIGLRLAVATGSIVTDLYTADEIRLNRLGSVDDLYLAGVSNVRSDTAAFNDCYWKDYYLCQRDIVVTGSALEAGDIGYIRGAVTDLTQSISGGEIRFNIDKFALPADELIIKDSIGDTKVSYTNNNGQPDDGIWGGDIFEVT